MELKMAAQPEQHPHPCISWCRCWIVWAQPGVLCCSFFFGRCILNILHVGNCSCVSWVCGCVWNPFPRMRHHLFIQTCLGLSHCPRLCSWTTREVSLVQPCYVPRGRGQVPLPQ